ncbi:hypothetical protein AJ79_06186 [Helicocarpus griseus UAMH5409]|uniref:Myosin class II heavy chain n=1 Tax=Helicocarpus griseus UAMH5409 TaxID=1447875 RepID=A0A2B7XFJ9_9EURO|nr:hypothetical protein AJ79_06186 [Helicocarpus griseus UAMH5409]
MDECIPPISHSNQANVLPSPFPPYNPTGSHLPADSANPVLRLTSVDGRSETSPVQDSPIATIPSLKRSATPGASSLQAAPSLGQPRLPSPGGVVPLPSLPKYHTESDSLSSSPDHKRTDSSVYYTTTWGSPYATPSSKRYPSSVRNHFQEDYNSGESSPSSTKSTHPKAKGKSKGSLRPSSTTRFSKRFYGSLGRSAATRGRQGKPIQDFTEEWINQYLSGQPRSERTNWLSDDSGDSGTGSFLTAQNFLDEDQSEGWLGLEDDSQDEDLLRTPTSRTFLKGKSRDLSRDVRLPRHRPKHIPKKSTDTLKQSDFWDFGYEPDTAPTTTAMSDKEASKGLSPNPGSSAGDSSLPISPIDKPLPPPPANEQNEGTSQPLPVSPLLPPKQSRTSTPAFQRPKKKVQWGKKQCIIALPLEDRRGSFNGGFHLLTPDDVAKRLKMWEDEGYDTSGYEQDPSVGEGGGTQSRPTFPDARECLQEWKENKFSISFPDQAEWEAYVNFLKEEKLRALGVFLDPEPTSAISQASSQLPGNTFSPPIPTSSAASNQFGLPTSAFSAPFTQPAISASTPGAFASPAASPFGLPSSSSFPTQPGLIGTDPSFNQGFPFLPFQPTPPAQGTFTPPNFFVSRQGGISPVGSTHLPNMNSMLPPVSPLTSDDAKQFPGTMNLFSQLNGQLPAQAQQYQQQHQRDPSQLISPPLEGPNLETEVDTDMMQSPAAGPEIAHPTPRGHRHNVSETLQKGVEQAEYHLEDSIRRQLEEDDKQPDDDMMKSRWAVSEEPEPKRPRAPSKALPQQRLFGEHEDEDGLPLDGSDIDTNPSLAGSFHGHFGDHGAVNSHQANASASSFTPRHRSRTSVSTLNVDAKEFDPSNAFASNTFSFTGNSFQPPSNNNNNNNTFSASNSIFSPNLSQQSGKTGRKFHATAPSFAPGAGSNAGSFSSNTNFKFSAASFNIDAPVFNPGRSITSDTGRNTSVSGSDAPAPSFTGGKIFGDFDPNVIVKPAKRSKAIPIIRPDENVQKPATERKHVEDEGDRVGQDGRGKRARRAGSDAAEEAEVALPSNPLAERAGAASLNNIAAPAASPAPAADGKENATPQEVVKEVPEKVETKEDATVVEVTPVSKDTPVSQIAEWRPFEFNDGSEAAAFNAAFPSAPGHHSIHPMTDTEEQQDKDRSASKDTPVEAAESSKPPAKEEAPAASADDKNAGAAEPSKPSSVLKPTAKAFEFKPAIPPQAPMPAPAAAPAAAPVAAPPKETKPVPKKNVGLEGSRYAVSTPPSSPPPAKYATTTAPPSSPPEAPVVPEEEEETLPLSDVASGSDKDAEHDSLNEQEIDAVMRQLNDADSDLGIERFNTPQLPDREVSREPLAGPRLAPSQAARSNAPSPSTLGVHARHANLPKINPEADGRSQHLSPQRSALSGSQSPVLHLNNPDNERVSDWDDAISVGEDVKLRQRSRFFDRHVNEIVGGILENRLDPLERTLGVIQQSLGVLASQSASQAQSQRRSVSAEVDDSDADDEDDEGDQPFNYRARSPLNRRDRRVDKIKQAVSEALASQAPRKDATPPVDLTEIQIALAELKMLAAPRLEAPAPDQPADLKQVIVDAISEHPKLNAPVQSVSHADNMEAMKMQVEGLQTMLRVADERAEKEHQTRRDAQDSLAQCQRLLRIAEEDAALHRDSAIKAEAALRDLRENKLPETERIERQSKMLQEQQESLQLTLSELSEKNIALEGTLDEYRLSGDHWRTQVEQMKTENKDLKFTINHMKKQIEDSMAARQGLRKKFERLQDDMVSATRDIARDQATWRKKEEDLVAKNSALRASYDREVKLREKLELDISDLQQQEKEATKLRFIFGQSQQENARLEELLMTLRQENHDLQNKAARFEREFNEARESSHIEIKRARKAMEADLDAANNQVNYVRAELEAQISNLQNQLDNVRLDADTAKARHELQLEEATDAKKLALAEAAESKETALQEQRLLHERGLNDLRERHARALHNSSEDRTRGEAHLMELLALRDEKIEHLEDKLYHVEEKLEIAKSAARAAAQAAQNAKGVPAVQPPSQPTSPSLTFRRGSEIPEKISPQALRESIMVLQDQLQQREGRIEELEQELSTVDKDAPAKVKERETEINWLRELLGVRLDDLQDIINTLSKPSFNQQAVRDAAIRLKANVQMEQQEKERAMSGNAQQFPSLLSLSTLAASPRSLPLAAAAAWGNWRKGRENSVISNRSANNINANAAANDRTPSKGSNNAPSFLSGLLTPPSSNVRQSPANYSAPPAPMPMNVSRRSYSETRPLRSFNAGVGSSGGARRLSTRQLEKLPQELEPPTTPPLLRQSSYDRDAEATNYGDGAYDGYGFGDDDNVSVLGGVVSGHDARAVGGDGPFGPSI